MNFSIAILLLTAVVTAIISFVLGAYHRKKTAESHIESAEKEAKRIVDEAAKLAETKKQKILLDAKDEVFREKNEAEKQIDQRRKEVQKQEKRVIQREEMLEKKIEDLDLKKEKLNEKEKLANKKLEQVEQIKQDELRKLEAISGFSIDQAKDKLLADLQSELTHEKALKLIDYENQLKEDSDVIARKIISLAIEKCAAEHVSEATVSVVQLPNDEMKGRIIGREGRNIRTIETLTGVDLIIDDTPEAITLSSFDPVRREVAKIALEKLISDGRIHPTRIEDTVNKAQKEVENMIKSEGERAIIEVGVTSVKPELVKLIGRLKFRTSYGQSVLDHSIEVAYISGTIASELGIDPTVAKRAGLLHDIGKALDYKVEGSHVDIGVNIAKKYKESEAVIHAIHAHHGDIEPKTAVACIVKAADALSAARPGARRENLENYVKRLQKLEEIAASFEGVDGSFAIQAGREVRIMVRPDSVSDEKMVVLARDICKKIESEMEYPGQVKVNIIRENRVVDYAR